MKDIHATSSLARRMSLAGYPAHTFLRYTFMPVAFVILILLMATAAGGCNSRDEHMETISDASGESSSELRDQIDGKWLITQPDRVYSVEDFLAIGWKKSKQLDKETLPKSIDAWYGFYMQKDIELP